VQPCQAATNQREAHVAPVCQVCSGIPFLPCTNNNVCSRLLDPIIAWSADWVCCAVLCVQADIIQMCANAKVYNHPKPHKEADVIFKYSLKYVSTSAVLHILKNNCKILQPQAFSTAWTPGANVTSTWLFQKSSRLGFTNCVVCVGPAVLDRPHSQTRMPLPLTAHAGEPCLNHSNRGSLHDAVHQPLQSLHR
jgi:hypothetical protein